MRIAAMAAGAVGGYFGARMAAAGHDVFFIARGAHRDAIEKNGLKIESVDGVDRLSAILGADRVVGGAAYIATTIASPGVIRHTSQFAIMRFGRSDKKPDEKLNAFVAAGKAAKLDIDLS